MATYDAGDARLQIFPDASKFKAQLETDLKKLNIDIKVPVQPNLGQASADLERWRDQQQRNKVELKVDIDTAGASAQLGALERTIKSVTSAASPGGGGAGLGDIFGTLTSGPGGLAALAGLLPTVGVGFGQVAAAVEQLAGVAPIIPGALASIVSVAGTVKLAMSGVSDAFDAVDKSSDGTQKSIDAANAALKTLAPNAAAFVKTAVNLKDQATKVLQQPIQNNFFDGLSQSAQKLYDNDIPILQQRLPELATSINGILKSTLDSLGSDQSKGLLDSILGNTDEATGRLKIAIQPAIDAVLQLANAGSGALPQLATDIGAVATKLDNIVTGAVQDGSLDAWIQGGIDGFGNLIDTAGNVASAIGTVADAAGGDLLQNLDDVSGKLATWLQSKDGQADLLAFLATGKQDLGDITGIAKNLGPAFADGFKTAAGNVQVLLDSLNKITGWWSSLPPWLQHAVERGASLGLINPSDPNPAGQSDGDQSPFLGGPKSTPPGGVPAPNDQKLHPGIIYRDPSGNPIPDNQLTVPVEHGRASGGVLPGYSPGKDNMLVPMSGGEGVIIPTVTRQLGHEGIAAINRGALTHGYANGGVVSISKRGYAPGGIIDPNGNPITPGVAPGPGGFVPGAGPAPIAPADGGGGFGGIFGSILSGLGGPISNLTNLAGAPTGSTTGTGFQSTGSFMDRLAGVPGLAGLIGSAGSSDPGAALDQWGGATGKWLGGFAAKTLGGFGSALWQGALGLVGLDNSILSPSNPYFQDIAKTAGAQLGPDSLLGNLFGTSASSSSSKSKGPTAKQIREAQDSVADKTDAIATAQARVDALTAKSSQSARLSATQGLAKAQREQQEAQADLATLMAGGQTGVSSVLTGSYASAAPTSGGGAESWRPVVRAALAQYGPQYGITNIQAWEDAMVTQLNTESGGRADADNPTDSNGRGGTQHVSGIAQFLPQTFAANNITGGAYTDPKAQIAAMIPYVAQKYGMTASGAPLGIGTPGRGYAGGGAVAGPGGPKSDDIPAWLSNDEHVLPAEDVAALGGQSGVYRFRSALQAGKVGGYAGGGGPGGFAAGVVLPPPNLAAAQAATAQIKATPKSPIAAPKQTPGVSRSSAPPAPSAPPVPGAPVPPPNAIPDKPFEPGVGQPAVGAAPTDYNHNLAAINTGISSGAAAIGNAVSTAIGVAGSSGFSPGAGALGPLAAGAIQEGGKIVTDLVNVGSSFLVGSVPGNLGGDGPAQGETLRSAQNVPDTAQDNRRSYNIQAGYQPSDLIDAIQLKEAQDHQADLARFRY